MTATLPRAPKTTEALPPLRDGSWHLPVVLGVFGFVVVFAGSWIPSFWGDEAASVMSAERTLPSLFAMTRNVDAVHAVYYLFLHFWIQIFGPSELSARLPSAIAIGAAVAGTFVLGRMLANRNVAIASALICAVLPRTSFMGADARSSAMATAVAVWATVLLITLMRRRFGSTRAHRLAWLSYSLVIAAGIYLFMYLGLVLLVHGAFLLTQHPPRRLWRQWCTSALIAVTLSLPLIGIGYAQRGQIAFLSHRNYATAKSVLVMQWFGNPYLAAASWLLIVVAIIGATLSWRTSRQLSPMVSLVVMWIALPTSALLLTNMVTPAYNLRYVSFCVPGVALAVATGIWSLRGRTTRIVAAILVLVFAVPTDIGQREPFAKDGGSDLAQTAAIIGQQAHPGDGIIFDRTTPNRQRPRLALQIYPADFIGLDDVALKSSYVDRAELWDTTYPLVDIAARLAPINHVWLVEVKGSPDNTLETDVAILENDGFTLDSTQRVHRTIIYSLVKR